MVLFKKNLKKKIAILFDFKCEVFIIKTITLNVQYYNRIL